MTTRSIVTSQPDVACDVCGRRLLRGERPDTFLAGGQRRTVCELCAPRATHEGWLREDGSNTISLPPARPRRGRNLLGRLRGSRESAATRPAASGPAESLSAPAKPQSTYEQRAMEEFESVEPLSEHVESPSESVEAPREHLEPPPAHVATLSESAVSPNGAVTPEEPADELSEDDATEAPEPPEEGSWRDAWMFVTE